jgi:polar amino acid transport system substrate-binding protein
MSRSSGRRRPLRLAAALVVLAAMTACGPAGGQRPGASPPAASAAGFDQLLHDRLPAHVRERGELRVASDATYPPASAFAADGRTIEGFEPDLAATLSRVLGVAFSFVRTDFTDALPALEDGRVDLVMTAMTDTVERQAKADFVDYFSAGTSIVVQRGNPQSITELPHLCGRTVAVAEGTVQVDLLQRTQRTCGAARIDVRQFPDNAMALVELRTGRAAAVLSDYPPAAHLAANPRTRTDFELGSARQYEPGLYGIALRKDDTALRDAVHEALGRVIDSGEYAEILARWGVASGAVPRATLNGGTPG